MQKCWSHFAVLCGLAALLGCQPLGAKEPFQRGTLQHDGLERRYVFSVPAAASGKSPLVLLLHGALGTGETTWHYTDLPRLAQREGFILIAPDGIDKVWNDGREATLYGRKSNADDVGFLLVLIDKAIADYHADPRRIYLSGISNGGMMSYRLLCEHHARFAAVASVIATLPQARAETCPAEAVVPVQITLGTDDPILPWAGGASEKTGVAMLSGVETFDYFARRAGCQSSTSTALPNKDGWDGSTITAITGLGCKAAVQLLRVDGGGHQWINGRDGWLFRQIVGRANRDADGAELVWNFFKAQQKSGD